MDQPALWLGTLACASLAAGGLLTTDRRRRAVALAAAMALGAVLVTADNWDQEPLSDLRERTALLLAAAAAAAAAVVALAAVFRRRPWLLPVALVATLPLRIPVDVAGTTSNLLLPLYAVIAAGLLVALTTDRLELPARREGLAMLPAPLRWLPVLLAAFVLLYAIQAAYTDDLSAAVETVGFFLVPFAAMFALLADAPWDRRTLRVVVVVAVAEALVVAIVGFGQFAAGEVFWNEKVIAGNEAHQWFRVNSLFWDPNIMGRYLAVTMIVLAAVVAWSVRRRRQLVASALFVVLLAALAITFSQTSLLALIAGLLALIAVRWGLLAFAGTLAAVLAGLFAAATIDGSGVQTDASGRTGLVSGGIELARDRPVAGHGSGSFAERFEATFGGGDGVAVVSHTEPVTVAAEQGAVGLAAYAALLGASLLGLALAAGLGRRGRAVAGGLLAAYVVMVVHSLGYAAFLTDPITWTLLALALVLPGLEPPPAAAGSARPQFLADPA